MNGLISYHAYYLSRCSLASFLGVFEYLCIPYGARYRSLKGNQILLISSIKLNYDVPDLGLAAIIPEPSSGSPSAIIAPYRAQYNQSPTFICCILSSNPLFFGCLPTDFGFKIVKVLKASAQQSLFPLSLAYISSYLYHPSRNSIYKKFRLLSTFEHSSVNSSTDVPSDYTKSPKRYHSHQLSPSSDLSLTMEPTYQHPRPQYPSLPSAPPHHPSLTLAVKQPVSRPKNISKDVRPASRPQTSHHSEHCHAGLSRPNKPSMVGWWKCCQDKWENNPAFNREFCAMCRHRRCSHGCKPCSN